MRQIRLKLQYLKVVILILIFLFPPLPQVRAATLSLSIEENAWLKANDRRIKLAHTPDWPPMDFLGKEGAPTGMVADYIALIENKLNFKFKVVSVKSWGEILHRARSGTIDAISAGQPTQARREFMNWSTPFLKLKTTIIVKRKIQEELTLEMMEGMKVGVVDEYAVGEFIRDIYPELILVDVPTSIDGIRRVSFGELDAMITELPNALYIIDQEKITNLRLAGDTGFELKHGIGIRKDWPIFSAIIEKAIAAISEEEHQKIYKRWVKLETPVFYETRLFWYWVLGLTSIVLLVIVSILIWNRELKKQVFQRTQALRFNEIGLEALLILNEHPHQSIQEIITFSFRQMLGLTQSSFGYLTLLDPDGVTYILESKGEGEEQILQILDHDSGFTRNTIGFWGDAVRSGKPVISNDYVISNPNFSGIPGVYRKINRYMNVPIYSEDKIVVVAGMGNKATDYTQADLRQLILLAQGMWRLIQRKKAEQGMQKSEQRFQDLIEYSPNGIAIVQDNTVVYENSKQAGLMGDLNFLDPPSDDRFHQDDLEKVKTFFGQVIDDTLEQTEVAFRFYPDKVAEGRDELRWVSCIATPIDYQDRDAFLLIFIDMTEAKQLTHLLTIQDKMASLGHVSAGIAHEIRNPLSGINIYLGTIEKFYKNPDKTKKIEDSIQGIRNSSKKIDSVIRRVMNFAKPTEPKFALIDINEPVNEAIKLIRVTLRKQGIRLIQEVGDGLPRCYAEPHLIEEVILNLINNAADALGKKEGNSTIKIATWLEKNQINVGIEDNGGGVPREIREKIFEPFFTTKSYSTGIGLTLCHRIITDHKGKLSLVQSPLGGAGFVISIPLLVTDTQQKQVL